MNKKHGCTALALRKSGSPLWKAHYTWLRMKTRCTDPTSKDFANYGGRGITYDQAWTDFSAFLKDMGPPPEGLTLERKDNDGNYCKENCIWADRLTQSRNRRNKRLLEFDGKSMRLSEWAEHLGVPVTTLKNRFYRGWPIEKVLSV